ncbi:glycosyltransferase family 4 protein [Marinomonas sp. A79]|uniref:Glycosyltransferase family 4 protein n=1 Tax=Marinomonas vulgaris TaxID=2823372 RepID=A0ABS5HCE4_9GAMM|nr:glycosyltransferase family 4 protein [Marinomonas vulgaris]MBR7889325.1 glycosyltransferase family 4 protein [Marinomonas vulgaris]
MKILIFSHEFPPAIGGAGVVADEYAMCLTKAGHDVTVLTSLRENASYADDFIVHQVKKLNKLWFLSYRSALDFEEYDLIVLNDVGAAYTAGLFFNKTCLSKSIILLHGSEPETIFLKPSYYRKLTFFKTVYKRVLNNVVKIIAVSDFMKSKFLNYTKLYHLSQKIEVLHNFISHDVFYPQPDPSYRKSLGLPEDAFLMVTASRVVLGKGYLEKISIFERLVSKSEKNLFWLIAGDGNDLQEIKNKVKALKLDERILFLGSLPRKDLVKIYSNANLFWLLSNYEESLGLVYIEAQACGCPALARNAAGAKEAILDGKTGYLVDNEDQVLKLFSSSSFLKFDKRDITKFTQGFHCSSLVDFVEKLNLLQRGSL